VSEVLERVEGRSGELVLRRRAGHLEVILDGAFLISTENEASSRALVTVGLEAVGAGDGGARGEEDGRVAGSIAPAGTRAEAGVTAEAGVRAAAPTSRGGLEVLIGGLGLGYALDEALASPRVVDVTVVEYEPAVVRWFELYGAARAAAAQAAAARAAIVVGDVADVLRSRREACDLVCLDTDNGPGWLVREANAGLYDAAGVALAHDALRRGGAAVFWSTGRYPDFEARLRAAFGGVAAAGAHDVVAGRRHDYVMYVARRVD